MEPHPLCLMFPEMSKPEFGELVEHVASYGQLHPIVTHEGMILDGRNRHTACIVLGRTPVYREWSGEGGTPLAFVVGCNLQRRNLDASQRAAIALNVKDQLREEYKALQVAGLKRGAEKPEARVPNLGKTGPPNAEREAAAMMNVSHGYVSDAERIREAAPAVFEAVKAGEMTIPEAKREIAKRAPQVHDAPPEPSIEEVVGRLAADLVQVVDRYGGHVAPVIRTALADVRALAARLENLTS